MSAYLRATVTLLALGFVVVVLLATHGYVYVKAFGKGRIIGAQETHELHYQKIKRLCYSGKRFHVDDRAYTCRKSVSL